MKVTDLDNLKEFHRVWSYGRTTSTFSECANFGLDSREGGCSSMLGQADQFESCTNPRK
jgi:hypothetical protein